MQRVHGFVQVGRLGIQKRLALTGHRQLVKCGQIDRTQRRDLAVEAVNLGLQTGQAHAAVGQCLCHRLKIGLSISKQLGVLLKTNSGRLLFELELGDPCPQWVKLALLQQAPLVTGAQLGGQIVVLAAKRPQLLLPRHLDGQRLLQTALRGGIIEACLLFLCFLLLSAD